MQVQLGTVCKHNIRKTMLLEVHCSYVHSQLQLQKLYICCNVKVDYLAS